MSRRAWRRLWLVPRRTTRGKTRRLPSARSESRFASRRGGGLVVSMRSKGLGELHCDARRQRGLHQSLLDEKCLKQKKRVNSRSTERDIQHQHHDKNTEITELRLSRLDSRKNCKRLRVRNLH